MNLSVILYLVGLAIAIASMVISASVNSRFKKWSKDPNHRRITGREVAERMLRNAGINDVTVISTGGNLTDHYNPKDKTVNLSEGVYDKATIAAVAVAAHECGHAIQHHDAYAPLVLRHKMVPVVNIGSQAGWYLFLAGLIFGGSTLLLDIGIILFSLSTAFHFVTLPVEFNASKRALVTLRESNILMEDEMGGARKVLSAAAMTYVAAAAAAAIQLLRLIARRNRN